MLTRVASVLSSCVLLALAATPAQALAPPTTGYAAVLKAAVDGHAVDYAAVRTHLAQLDAYLARVARTDRAKLGGDAKAFYINAYNALVLKAVVTQMGARGGKLGSVMEVKGFFDAIPHTVAGEQLTLNALEETRLRKAFNDPRIHFAVNCASASCPPLASTPYTTTGLDAALDAATAAYLAGPEGLRTTAGGGVSTSKLMEWYAGDFGGTAGVQAFLLKHAPAAFHAAIRKGPITFHEYGWALNKK